MANAQGTQVLSLAAVNGPGISEIEFTVVRTAGVTEVFSARPDLVLSVSNGVAGVYVVTLVTVPTSSFPSFPLPVSAMLMRGAASTARSVQFRNDSTSTTVNLLVTDDAGALVNLANDDGFHVVLRFRRDGGIF